MMHCIGLMSGTSMDGVDAALIKTDGENLLLSLAHCALPYPSDFQMNLKAIEFAVQHCRGNIRQVREIFTELATEYYRIAGINNKKAQPEKGCAVQMMFVKF